MIVKYVSPEVFNAISNRSQSYIAKLNAGFWSGLKVGEGLILTDGERNLEISIRKISYFADFGDAWFTYGDKLVPSQVHNIVTAGEAIRYFEKYYKREDVIVCGVIAFEVEPVAVI